MIFGNKIGLKKKDKTPYCFTHICQFIFRCKKIVRKKRIGKLILIQKVFGNYIFVMNIDGTYYSRLVTIDGYNKNTKLSLEVNPVTLLPATPHPLVARHQKGI